MKKGNFAINNRVFYRRILDTNFSNEDEDTDFIIPVFKVSERSKRNHETNSMNTTFLLCGNKINELIILYISTQHLCIINYITPKLRNDKTSKKLFINNHHRVITLL